MTPLVHHCQLFIDSVWSGWGSFSALSCLPCCLVLEKAGTCFEQVVWCAHCGATCTVNTVCLHSYPLPDCFHTDASYPCVWKQAEVGFTARRVNIMREGCDAGLRHAYCAHHKHCFWNSSHGVRCPVLPGWLRAGMCACCGFWLHPALLNVSTAWLCLWGDVYPTPTLQSLPIVTLCHLCQFYM